MFQKVIKFAVLIEVTLCLLLGCIFFSSQEGVQPTVEGNVSTEEQEKKDYIKWVEFDVPCEALTKAYEWDLKLHEQSVRGSWIDLLAYLAVKYGGDFKRYKEKDLNEAAEELLSGNCTVEDLAGSQKYYPYYLEAYTAVLGGFVGEYEIEVIPEGGQEKVWEKRYGLKAFSPIAKGYAYHDYDEPKSS